MSLITDKACSQLSEQFADIFQRAQDEYRSLLNDLRDDDIDVNEFTVRVESLMDRLVKLKRIRLQLRQERDELVRTTLDEQPD